jgi:hypothetical protein
MSSNGSPAMPVRNRTLDRRSKVIQAAQAAVLVAIISAFLPTLAHAQPPIVLFDAPYEFIGPHPCLPGEVLILTGRQTSTAYPRGDQAGGFHLTVRFITRAKGSTVTNILEPPKEYVFNTESVQETNTTSNGTEEWTITLNHILVRKSETDGTADPLLGTGDDIMLKQTLHLTVTHGVPTATVENGHAQWL